MKTCTLLRLNQSLREHSFMLVFIYVTLYGGAQLSISTSLLLPFTVMLQPHMQDPSEDSNKTPISIRRIYLNVQNCKRNCIYYIDVCQFKLLNSVSIIEFMIALEMNTSSDIEILFSATYCYRIQSVKTPIFND